MTFTYAEMRRLYAVHGNRLGWYDGEGDGPYSADPADYWDHTDDDVMDGYLAIEHTAIEILTEA